MRYDVLIVGGGPAGSVAGINLIGSGLRVAILDRARFPRLKPCGGGISCRVFTRFPYISRILNSIPTNFVKRVILESPSGRTVHVESGEPLYAMIRRIEFDKALLDHCRLGGIEIHENVTVARVAIGSAGASLQSTTGETFEADLVIGADGVSSTIAVHTRLRSPWQPKQLAIDGTEESPFTSVKASLDTMYIYFGMGGYGYVFPKAAHVNFGVGYLLDYMKKRSSEKLYPRHIHFLETLKQSGVLSGNSQRQNFHAFPLPISGPLKSVSSDRVLLAGDAAGFVNAFTAEGIYYAMVSGELAGKTAFEAIKNRNTSAAYLGRYDRACEAEIGRELHKSIKIQKRFYSSPSLIDLVVAFADRNSTVRRLITSFGVGQLSYEDLKRRIILEALPGYLGYQFTKLRHKLTNS